MSSDKKGYVYILSNPSLDDIKVGFTERAVEIRMKDLGGTALPTPFVKFKVLLYEGIWHSEEVMNSTYYNKLVTKSNVSGGVTSKAVSRAS